MHVRHDLLFQLYGESKATSKPHTLVHLESARTFCRDLEDQIWSISSLVNKCGNPTCVCGKTISIAHSMLNQASVDPEEWSEEELGGVYNGNSTCTDACTATCFSPTPTIWPAAWCHDVSICVHRLEGLASHPSHLHLIVQVDNGLKCSRVCLLLAADGITC